MIFWSTSRQPKRPARKPVARSDLSSSAGFRPALSSTRIEQRKADLARLLAPTRPGLRLNEWLDNVDGATIFEHACKLGLEGIVSKRKGSRYRSPALEALGGLAGSCPCVPVSQGP